MGARKTTLRHGFEIGSQSYALVVETETSTWRAMTAIHEQNFARRIGGLRMANDGSLQEVGHLASAMTYKCGASLIPFDGEKTLVCCAAGIPVSAAERSAVIADHLMDIIAADAGVTIGPDMAAGEDVMNLLGARPEFRDHVTGRSDDSGGLGVDKNGATAEGLVRALERVMLVDKRLRRATIQGFGAVGAGVAERLSRLGVEVVAVSNRLGTLEATQAGGLDIPALLHCRAESSQPNDDLELLRYADTAGGSLYHQGDPGRLMTIPTDVFVPAARTMVLAMPDELEFVRDENREARDARTFQQQTGVRLVLEGANHPLSEKAEEYLESQGVRVLVDFLVNMGGLVSCFFEWLYLPELLADRSAVRRINHKAIEWARMVGERNVQAILRSDRGARIVAHEFARENVDRMRSVLVRRSLGSDVRGATRLVLEEARTWHA